MMVKYLLNCPFIFILAPRKSYSDDTAQTFCVAQTLIDKGRIGYVNVNKMVMFI